MKKAIVFLTVILGLVSCNDDTSLQEYYVQNQSNRNFIAFDVPASLLTGDNIALDAEQRATLETIKKLNVLAFPKTDSTGQIYEQEKERLSEILSNDKYNQLMRYGGSNRKAALYYLGEEDAIDELIVFGSDDEKGFGIARVTGNDMNPEAIIKLLRSFDNNKLNVQGLPDLDGFLD